MADYFRDYLYIVDENGGVIMEDDMLLLENLTTGEIIKVQYSEAAEYYNLKRKTLFETVNNSSDIEDIPPYGIDPTMENVPGTSKCICSNETATEESVDDPVIPTYREKDSKSLKWGIEETRYMLELYSCFVNCIGPLKKFRTKKHMWAYIAIELTRKFKINFSGIQIETRYKCVIKRTKKAIDNNNTSGASRMESDFDEEIQAIVNSDDSLCPDFLISPGKTLKKSSIFHTKQTNTSAETMQAKSSTQASSTHNLQKFNLVPQHSTPESPIPESPIPGSSTSESSTQETSTNFNTETPRKRKRKTAQEQLFEKYLSLQTLKLKMKDEHLKKKELKTIERNEEKSKQQPKRHEEKMDILSRDNTETPNSQSSCRWPPQFFLNSPFCFPIGVMSI